MLRKKYILLLALLAFLSSCTKHEDNVEDSSEIVSWEIEYTTDESTQIDKMIESAIPFPIPIRPDDEKPSFEEGVESFDSAPIMKHGEKLATIAQPVPRAQLLKMMANTSGKIYFKRGGKNYVCSGNLVGAFDVVVTAAHCLTEGGNGKDSTDVIFKYLHPIPVSGPRFEIAKAHVSSHYRMYGGSSVADWAVLKLKRPVLKGNGVLGYWINPRPQNYSVTSYGYPADPPFDGESLNFVDSSMRIDPRRAPSRMNQNDMTGGSSGGAWVHNGRLVGLNGWRYSDPKMMYSPSLGSAFCKGLKRAGVKCP